MSRTYRGQERIDRRKSSSWERNLTEVPHGGFALFRPLDPEQSREIRIALSSVVTEVPGARVRGYATDYEAGITVVGKHETRRLDFLQHIDETAVLEAIYKYTFTLGDSQDTAIKSAGRFGSPRGSRITIAAALDTDVSVHGEERGNVHTALCELNNWDPVPLPVSNPHVSLINVPANTPPGMVTYLKMATDEILPKTLHFMPAKPIF